MKQIIISTIFFFLTSQTSCGQVVKRTYKLFTDTAFKTGDIIVAPEIYFQLGNCGIIPEHKDSVKIIADFITKHPSFKIEIGVHTDTRGKKDANIKLAECRAKSVLDCLTIELLLPIDNFTAKGYGSSQPRVSDDEIKRARCLHCDLHRKNRRVEIKILKT